MTNKLLGLTIIYVITVLGLLFTGLIQAVLSDVSGHGVLGPTETFGGIAALIMLVPLVFSLLIFGIVSGIKMVLGKD